MKQKSWVIPLFVPCLFIGLCAPPAMAEILHTKTYQGEWIEVDSTEWNEGKTRVGFHPKGIDLGYTVVHNDAGLGFGFDDPTLGPARLETVNAVLDYLNSILLDTGQVDVEFNRSEFRGSGTPLASASPFYPSGPNGFEPGRAFTHLTTGVDVSPSLPDIQVTIDFGYPWNSETDPPSGSEFDLFSVVLHELVHGLGILSLLNATGNSALTNSNPGVFSTFDRLLKTGNGQALFDSNGRFIGALTDLVGQDGGVAFQSPTGFDILGFMPRVLSPNPWKPGTSLSHWSPSNPGPAVMISGIAQGSQTRVLLPYEIAALQDLGYAVTLPKRPTSEVAHWFVYD